MTERETDICTCGHDRSRHVDGAFCMGARMAISCPHRCLRFTRDEKATREYNNWQGHIRAQHDRIRKAKPFIDEGAEPGKWLPSDLLMIGYSVLVTGPNPANAAIYLDETLNAARDLFRQGKVANPFAATPHQHGAGNGGEA